MHTLAHLSALCVLISLSRVEGSRKASRKASNSKLQRDEGSYNPGACGECYENCFDIDGDLNACIHACNSGPDCSSSLLGLEMNGHWRKKQSSSRPKRTFPSRPKGPFASRPKGPLPVNRKGSLFPCSGALLKCIQGCERGETECKKECLSARKKCREEGEEDGDGDGGDGNGGDGDGGDGDGGDQEQCSACEDECFMSAVDIESCLDACNNGPCRSSLLSLRMEASSLFKPGKCHSAAKGCFKECEDGDKECYGGCISAAKACIKAATEACNRAVTGCAKECEKGDKECHLGCISACKEDSS